MCRRRSRHGHGHRTHDLTLDRLATRLATTTNGVQVVLDDILRNHRPIAYGCVSSHRVPFAYEATTIIYPDDSLGLSNPDGYGVAFSPEGDRFRYCTVMSFPLPNPQIAVAWEAEQRRMLEMAIYKFQIDRPDYVTLPTEDPALNEAAHAEAVRCVSWIAQEATLGNGQIISLPEVQTPSPHVTASIRGIQRTANLEDGEIDDLMQSRRYGLGVAFDPTTGLSINVLFRSQ